jgi:hypothetical protein
MIISEQRIEEDGEERGRWLIWATIPAFSAGGEKTQKLIQ